MPFLGFLALTVGGLLLWVAWYGQPLQTVLTAFVKGEPLPGRVAVNA